MRATQIHLEWTADCAQEGFRTGVSLHSHTLHSKESLDFIYKVARHCAPLQWILKRSERRYEAAHGAALDLRRGWWTPPMAPADAYRLESGQIEGLGLRPIVSLSDHDDIEAPMSLQAMNASLAVPVSVEWTVPFRETFFHIGVHNLPSGQARGIMRRLAEFTARPEESLIASLLHEIHGFRDTLVVFNHPLWDEKGVGHQTHCSLAGEFLSLYSPYVHALEINGLRPWRENAAVTQFAAERGKPIVSGGDRHTLEANVTLNFTNAMTFAGFADEVRNGQLSNVWISSAYRQCHSARIFHNMLDVFRTYPDHGLGWSQWTDRVFFEGNEGAVKSLAQTWGERPPAAIGLFGSAMRLAGQPQLRSALQAVFSRSEEVAF